MLIIQEEQHTIKASFEGVRRFTCEFSEDVEKELIPFVEDSQRELIFSLKGIHFIDTSAFDTILNIYKTAQRYHSTFIVSNINQDVRELFELLNLTDILTVSEN